ncbi:hypothetical protein GRX01_18615 [Halobaculum sp. WSA2]|uniref:Cox cluster protein n=1 Tax=Halobaculum saliterrae TaxID=2073113 RepID=A0A6B0T154_9EURY|nr:DUF6684 family protein [Halobaculum saliterrae]MXR43336.1 hypothetical protein [Halobaculum saliterrae]
MAPDSDARPDADADADAPDAADDDGTETSGSVFSGRTLSDLTVNAVPVAMLVAFVVGFGVLAPGDLDSDPLLGFHAALIAGVVLVSAVAARAVVRAGGELDGEREVRLYETDDRNDADGSGDADTDGSGDRDDSEAGPEPADPGGAAEGPDDERPRRNP